MLNITEANILSTSYNISNGIITGVLPETTQSEFLKNIAFTENVSVNVENLTPQNNVKTGSLLKSAKNGNETKVYTIIVSGDINCDGKLSILDLVRFKRNLANEYYGDLFMNSGDLNRSGNVDATDLSELRIKLLNWAGK